MKAVMKGTLAALLLAMAAGCSKDGGRTDAGVEAGPIDAPVPDAPPTPLTVDFTVIDCPMFDGTIPRCRGPAPLTVSFAPITTGNVSRLLWDFGDQTTSSDPTPTHTYALPDSYDVVLLGAPGLSSPPRKGFIEVTTNPLGGPCDITPQCEANMACLCGQAAQCPAAFARGVCTLGCAAGSCPEGAVCADLGRGLPAPTGQTWRAAQCLRACTGDTDCAQGQRCRTVPVAGGPMARWQTACFFDFPSDPGAPCRGPGGAAQDDICLGGRCADFGARGLCTADCAAAPCPSGTACALFGDGRKLCLRRCEGASGCNEDPLLACATEGGAGPLAFTLVGADATRPGTPDTMPPGYCAPRPCTSDAVCAPAGVCMGAPAGHCALPPR
jgi:hypothetical protein